MEKRHPALGWIALAVGVAALALALVAAALSAADSGTSGGPQFVVAERWWLIAAAVGFAALVLGVTSLVSRRGARLGAAAIIVTVAAAPIAIFVMDALPAA